MTGNLDDLQQGDICEIKYRVWRPAGGTSEHVIERWIRAEIIAREPGTWPLARLADGQVTEIRPFMTLRIVHSARLRCTKAIAA